MKPFRTQQMGKSYFLFILIAIVAIGSGLLVQTSTKPPAEQPEFKKTILLPTPKELGEVKFTDYNGQAFGSEKLKGKWSIMFFAFTNCPDICPTTMQTLKQVKASLSTEDLWHNYQVIMVSVDPERDTSERLKSYVPFFDPEFIGVSAPVDYTTKFAKNVGILFFKGKTLENGGYDVDHGASIILVNPKGQYAGVMTAPHLQSEMTTDLISLAKYDGVSKNEAASPKVAAAKSEQATEQTIQNTSAAALSIENAWIRPAPPTVANMAAYFDLVNNSEQDIKIVDSNSPEFEVTMIHDTIIEDGVASMNHLDSVTIPAGGRVSLAPMAKHMMLIGPKAPLALGGSATLILTDQNGEKYTQTVTVKQPQN